MTNPDLEFQPWPKTFRLNRDVIVTEKIDGSNAAVKIVDAALVLANQSQFDEGDRVEGHVFTLVDGRGYLVGAQSRKKNITPESDNFGFARWVHDNANKLATALGDGIHFGEWYGSGIQRAYTKGEPREKRFMLFNTTRWGKPETREYLKGLFGGRVEVATVLYEGPFDVSYINGIVAELKMHGSRHVEGFSPAEGVVVHHTQAGFNLKVTCDADEQPKGISRA